MMNIDYVFKEKYIFVVLNSEHCFAKFIPIHTILQIRTFISKQDNEYIVSSKTIKIIRLLRFVDISKISKLDLSDEVKNEINNFIDDYYDRYTGLYLKSKSFLKNIAQIK